MANVFVIGLERETAAEIATAPAVARHNVFERPHSIETRELSDAGIVFAGGSPPVQQAVLRRIRHCYPTLPVVAVLETFNFGDWHDALEAGATDYCWAPIGSRHIQLFIESFVRTLADGSGMGLLGKTAEQSQGSQMNRTGCPRCGAIAAAHIHRRSWERALKPWRIGWNKMECDVCYKTYWIHSRKGADKSIGPGPGTSFGAREAHTPSAMKE